MLLNKFIYVALYGINLLCWTFGKYLLIGIKEEPQEDAVEKEDNESYPWKDLEDNDVITLSPPGPELRGGLGSLPHITDWCR
jgi:hypothetical protein